MNRRSRGDPARAPISAARDDDVGNLADHADRRVGSVGYGIRWFNSDMGERSPTVEMLWEATDLHEALTKRFGFRDASYAANGSLRFSRSTGPST
jgi:hypothetical protein